MNDELLNALRYRSEGPDIDFKAAQYRFVGGTEEDKSETLKDILAMANAWRDGPGYILLGFKDQRPHPAAVVGISGHIDDAALQQFVNGKVKPKLTFRYEEHLFEGKTVGVISIPKQRRPFYLAHAYGKLKSNVVYVRRGSSTDEAEPPEVVAMTASDAGRRDIKVDLSVRTPDNADLPATVALRYLRYKAKFPDYSAPRVSTGPFDLGLHATIWHDNRSFWRQAAEYLRTQSALVEMHFVLTNRSAVALSAAKLEVTVEPLDGQGFELNAGSELRQKPERQWSHIHGMRTMADVVYDRREPQLVVDRGAGVPVCHVRFGTLLPGEQARSSDTLALVLLAPGRLRLRLRVLAAELENPIESELKLEATGTPEVVDLDRLEQLFTEYEKALYLKRLADDAQ